MHQSQKIFLAGVPMTENPSNIVQGVVVITTVIRSCTKPPVDLITTYYRGNLKIVGLYSPMGSHISRTKNNC